MRRPNFAEAALFNIRAEGELLPPDVLLRILSRDAEISGLSDADYNLSGGERLSDALNRSWQKMLSVWQRFSALRETLSEEDTGTRITREYLLLPLFAELGYGRLLAARPEDRSVKMEDGRETVYPVSHFWQHSPIHLVGCHVELDKKTRGVAGAAKSSPHSLVQEFLNRSDAHLWGFVSNGLLLRILRDNVSFSRQTFIEFDLQGIFNGECFSDFALLWMLCHQSRVESDTAEACRLEQWMREARNAAIVALDSLRDAVSGAIVCLGQGFLESGNQDLRQKLAEGSLKPQHYFHQLLRLAYRLIFLFVVEDRHLLHAPHTPQPARDRYARWYSSFRLRRLAALRPGSRHSDLFEGIKLIMRSLGSGNGCPELGLSPMGSFLWSDDALPDLMGCRLSNAALLGAVRELAFTTANGRRRPVDFRHLGTRELGSIYESLLELHPEIESTGFCLKKSSGNERKSTGSYYTPTQLIESLLDSALEPVIRQALKSPEPETALLELNICDPACGSGHFLIAAAHRLAKRLAALRTGDDEPAPDAVRHALRDVVGRCLYGVDINPMSVELCKVSLWLEAVEPGKPLSFLDHHIQCADSLLGATRRCIEKGLPDEAFKALSGDDSKACTALKKRNRQQRGDLLEEEWRRDMAAIAALAAPPDFDAMPSDTPADMERCEKIWQNWIASEDWQRKKFLFDLWCAAFVLRRFFPEKEGYPGVFEEEPFGVTLTTIRNFVRNKSPLAKELVQAVQKTAEEYRFFHVAVAFPEVEAKGGFDVILGNPPWERIKLQEKEWFAVSRPDIANAANAAARKRCIAKLEWEDPVLFASWQAALRRSEGQSHFLRNSGRYPLCGRGDVNLYAVFAEHMRQSLNETGRMGCIVPSGIATDDTTKFFFQDMVTTRSLISLYDFENRKKIFDIDSRIKFCLLTTGSGAQPLTDRADFVFFAHSTDELNDPARRFSLSAPDIALLNPNTRTCPIFRTRKDAELTRAVYRRVPVLIREADEGRPEENPWGIRFRRLFDMSNDSHLFRTREQLENEGRLLQGNVFVRSGERYLPLYEAKMVHHFNHRWATYDGTQVRDTTLAERRNTGFSVLPRYWVPEEKVWACLEDSDADLLSSILQAVDTKDITTLEDILQNLHSQYSPQEIMEELQKTKYDREERVRELLYIDQKPQWLMGWRDITNATNERTVIFSLIPVTAVGHTCPLIFSKCIPAQSSGLMINLTMLILDFIARQKVGGTHLTYGYLTQLPLFSPKIFVQDTPWHPQIPLSDWLRPRILELTYTAEDMRPFAEDMGYDGEPFVWDEERRFHIRAELDAAFFHLYLPANPDGTWKKAEETEAEYQALCNAFATPRHAVEHIMETFPITKRNDEARHGIYRTKEAILQNYDAMLVAVQSGNSFCSQVVMEVL